MSSATRVRDEAARVASSNPERAVELARSISDPWFRCQALSAAARHHPRAAARARIIDEAIDAANEAGDPNRVVTVSAWPIKVLTAHGQFDRVEKEVRRLLDLIATESSPVRRADALKYLFGAVVGAPRKITTRVVEALVSAALEPLAGGRRNTKGASVLSDCLPAIARMDEQAAADVLSRLPPAREKGVREQILAARATPLDQLVPWPHVGEG